MSTPAQQFLTRNEQDRLIKCVQDVESRTSGEIVPVIASTSYDYPRAAHLAGLIIGIVGALGLSLLLGRDDMWVFLALFLPFYILISRLFMMYPRLRRPFITKAEMRDEVEEAAITSFHANGLHRTRDMTGIIIYVSVYERMVQVLADKGINDKVNPEVWQEVVEMVTAGIQSGSPGRALCKGVERCGELITRHFPIKPDDTDELPNLIIEGDSHQ
ncbi:TPM domain-containing protein [Pseudodesulfovibrio sp.]|uniref:TPM domain-containing protein n=1 Tax=unclassified Pseudodesulfovibrio TaxID=2661612 RepID=UPI003B000D7F